MSDIVTERTGGILRVELNRPGKKNAMTAAMYTSLADSFRAAAADEAVRVVLWHGAGDAFCAGNDIGDFLHNPPRPGEMPQASLMDALIGFEKPIVAAVQGAAIGGGTTMLTHCDFVYAGESAKFQLPFINLALVPEFGSSFSLPACAGHLRAAELILLRGFHCHAGGRAGPRDPGGARPARARDRNRNRAEAGCKTERRVARLQATHETGLDRSAQSGHESREPGVR